MQTTTSPATTAKTSPIRFTAPEQGRLKDAQTELVRLDAKLTEVIDLKETIQAIGRDYAAGKVELVQAAAILTTNTQDRHELQQALKPHVKGAMRETVATIGDLITKARQHHLDELKKLASSIEKEERKTQAQLGVADDDFFPSPALCGLREQWSRSAKTLGHPPSRAELTNLLADI